MNEREFRKLKQENDEAKTSADRAQGAFDEAMKNLSEEFGVDNLTEAKAKLKRDEKISEEAESEFQEALADYKEKWGSE